MWKIGNKTWKTWKRNSSIRILGTINCVPEWKIDDKDEGKKRTIKPYVENIIMVSKTCLFKTSNESVYIC